MKKIGFIGCGNMAKAMIGGIVGKRLVAPEEILASNRSRGALDYAKETWGISITGDNRQVAKEAEIVVLAVFNGVLCSAAVPVLIRFFYAVL